MVDPSVATANSAINSASSAQTTVVDTTTLRTSPETQQETTVQQTQINTKFLEDDAGHPSSLRVFCGISLLAGIGFALFTLWLRDPVILSSGVYLSTMAWVGCFCPKLLQKVIEMKYAPSSSGKV